MAYGVTQIPSIYDFLGQGIQQFSQNAQARSQRELADKWNRLNFLTNLYGTGAVPGSTLSSAMAASGIPGLNQVQVGPSKPEQQKTFIAGLPADQQPGATASSLGIENPAEATARVRAQTAAAGEAEARAKQFTELSPTVVAQAKVTLGDAQSKSYDEAASRYIRGELGTNAPSPQNKEQTISAAFQKYMADRQNNGMGLVPQTEVPVLKAHFENAFRDAYIEQQKLLLEQRRAAGLSSPTERLAERLVQMEGNVTARANQLALTMQGMPTAYFTEPDLNKIPSIFRGPVREYRDAIEYRDQIRAAIESGLPDKMQSALTRKRVEQQGPPPAGGPPAAGGGRGGAPPTGAGAQLGANDQQYASRIAIMRQLDKATQKQMLDYNLKNGIIDQATYERMARDLGISK